MTSVNPLTHENNTRLRGLLSKLPNLIVTGFPEDLKSFTLFPNLPLEIRLKIWSYAGDHPRTLQLTDRWYMSELLRVSIEGNNQVPGILHACTESREEGLKHYLACTKRCSRWDDIHDTHGHVSSQIPCRSAKVYINFGVDRFYMNKMADESGQPGYFLGSYQLERRDLAKIQLLDITWGLVFFLGPLIVMDEAKSLREVNIIATPYFYDKVRVDSESYEAVCPNTISSEICMVKHRRSIKKRVEEKMLTDHWFLDATTLGLLKVVVKDTKFDCKWKAISEEMDLFPIWAGAAATYDSSSGSVDNKATVL